MNDKTKLMDAVKIAKQAQEIVLSSRIISIEANRVHMMDDAFVACFFEYERVKHSDQYDKLQVNIDGVLVFCLVEIEKPEATIAHQSV